MARSRGSHRQPNGFNGLGQGPTEGRCLMGHGLVLDSKNSESKDFEIWDFGIWDFGILGNTGRESANPKH
jgi:hypothetical protein